MVEAAPPKGFEEIHTGPGGYAISFGPVFRRQAPGCNQLGFWVSEGHANLTGVCHGGAVATFADMQVLAVLDLRLAEGKHMPTISLSVDYLAGAPVGSWLENDVTLLKMTRRMVFTQSVMHVGSEIIARSSAIYRTSMPRTNGLPERA